MKKMWLVLAMLSLLLVSAVSAKEILVMKQDMVATPAGTAVKYSQMQIQYQQVSLNKSASHLTVKGLANAITLVRNNETVAKLELVLNKIETKRAEQFAKLGNLTIKEQPDGTFEVSGKKEGKFLGIFKMERTVAYKVADDGSTKPARGFWLWRDEVAPE